MIDILGLAITVLGVKIAGWGVSFLSEKTKREYLTGVSAAIKSYMSAE